MTGSSTDRAVGMVAPAKLPSTAGPESPKTTSSPSPERIVLHELLKLVLTDRMISASLVPAIWPAVEITFVVMAPRNGPVRAGSASWEKFFRQAKLLQEVVRSGRYPNPPSPGIAYPREYGTSVGLIRAGSLPD